MSTQPHNNLTGKQSDSYDQISAQRLAHHRGGPSHSFPPRSTTTPSTNTKNPPEIGDRVSPPPYPEDGLVEGGINYNLVLGSGFVDQNQKEDTSQPFAGDTGEPVDKDNWSENTTIQREDTLKVNDSQHQANKRGSEKKEMLALDPGLGFETHQVEVKPQNVRTITPSKDGASTERFPIHTTNSTRVDPGPSSGSGGGGSTNNNNNNNHKLTPAQLYQQAMANVNAYQKRHFPTRTFSSAPAHSGAATAAARIPQFLTADEEKGALKLYEEARMVVERVQNPVDVGVSAPSAHDMLYPKGRGGASSTPTAGADVPPSSFEASVTAARVADLSAAAKKAALAEQMRATDASGPSASGPSGSPPPAFNNTMAPVSAVPTVPYTHEHYEAAAAEKEAVRLKLEAKDAAAAEKEAVRLKFEAKDAAAAEKEAVRLKFEAKDAAAAEKEAVRLKFEAKDAAAAAKRERKAQARQQAAANSRPVPAPPTNAIPGSLIPYLPDQHLHYIMAQSDSAKESPNRQSDPILPHSASGEANLQGQESAHSRGSTIRHDYGVESDLDTLLSSSSRRSPVPFPSSTGRRPGNQAGLLHQPSSQNLPPSSQSITQDGLDTPPEAVTSKNITSSPSQTPWLSGLGLGPLTPSAQRTGLLEDTEYIKQMTGSSSVDAKHHIDPEPAPVSTKYDARSGNPMWQWFKLKDHTMMDAVYNSVARSPPPRCHPGTRTTIIQKINDWLNNPQRERDLLWLWGMAGVGKSAVVQTLAESLSEVGRLGASLSFSRLDRRSDPLRVFPTLAYQFMVQDHSYREYITRLMLKSPGVLDKGLSEQFRLLILEPFCHENIRNGSKTWVITLDGLNECGGDPENRGHEDDIQRDIVRLISEFTQRYPTAPLVWIIASRPEAHLKAVFSEAGVAASRWEEEVMVDSEEGSQDVKKFLDEEFTKIGREHSNPEGSLPPSKSLEKVARFASGLFIFARVAMQFIAAPNPQAKLALVCQAINKMQLARQQEDLLATLDPLSIAAENSRLLNADKSFEELNAFYSRVVENIDTATQPTTWRILVFLCSIGEKELPAQILANFLSLSETDFYTALYRLHSVLAIPEPDDAGKLPIKFYHPSFRAFVFQYVVKKCAGGDNRHFLPDIQSLYYKWCDRWGVQFRGGPSVTEVHSDESWPGEYIFGDITQFLSTRIWEFWNEGDSLSLGRIRLRDFNFALHHNTGIFSQKIWQDLYHPTPDITLFLLKLHFLNSRNADSETYGIWRFQPECPTDKVLFDAYAYLINHKGTKKADLYCLGFDRSEWNYICLSLEGQFTGPHCFPKIRGALLDPGHMYFLLGHETNTCLVIMHRPTLIISQFFKEAFQQMRKIYAEVSIDGEMWPSINDLDKITSVSEVPQSIFSQARLPSLARAIVAFVGHPDYANPVNRLELVLDILSREQDQTVVLELLRNQSIADISPNILPAAGRILVFLFCHATKAPGRAILANQISLFLELPEDTVKKILRMTNLILSSRPLPFPMDAVADFDLSDLRDYCANEDDSISVPESDHGEKNPPYAYETMMSPQTWLEISVQYIRWCNHLLTEGTVPKDDNSHHSKGVASVSDPNTTRQEEAQFKQEVLAGGHWIAFDRVAREMAPGMVAELQGSIFFRMMALHCGFHLPHYDEMAVHFCSFVNKFYLYQTELDLEPLVRVERKCDMDDALLVEWKKQWDSCRQAVFPINSATRATFFFTTPETNWPAGTFSNGVWDYFWLGYDENTCLVTFLREAEDETEIVAGASTAEDLGT